MQRGRYADTQIRRYADTFAFRWAEPEVVIQKARSCCELHDLDQDEHRVIANKV